MTETKIPACCSCKSEDGLFLANRYSNGYEQYLCNLCNNKIKKRYYDKGKMLLLDHYGSRCTCCGETEPLFLSVDHINNDGHKELWPNGKRISGVHLYRRIVKAGYPATYQILCMNCNFGKRMNNGVCPHLNI